ncbi:MAG: B12-binding domain-containing radical SAM protein [Phenylobacterium sp.]|uniref:B12-binding domain-containing radical SAM protein n=1 Tax=Phenylobacterium sp. TaxID=1871053 RepID=UPI001A57B0D5|nr:radical SAM protein [Phenylobacterium sp.]MBL8772625.1 B12-binding domain-containing radical SAM protein [Phenylobacterium sp.]
MPAIDRASAPVADARGVVALIGFQKMGNLGLGYLSAVLRRAGWDVRVIDIEQPPEAIVRAVADARPLLVGFSLIFQYYIRRYDDLMFSLRRAGVDAHFTMGGHYPSLSPEQTLKAAPDLDSVVRFEGEETLLALVETLRDGGDWRALDGLVYRTPDGVQANPPRHLVHDLDALPFPDRDFAPTEILGRQGMPILASRGCARTCSFCSIHTFYRTAPGKVVRLRKTHEVVREMAELYETRGVTVFLFQDDDFPMFGPKWRAWAHDLVDRLIESGLSRKVIFKLNCRADAVDAHLLSRMRDAGLYLVYMGLESGDEDGLVTLNKEITVEQNLAAVRMLKDLGIRFEYGFMLLDPSSTFRSVRANLAFLREIVGDGCSPATFCKMLPYDGTPIKATLEAAGRLKGDVCTPDYDFLDPRLDAFYADLARIVEVTGWVHGPRALTMQLSWAHLEVAVVRRLFPALPDTDAYEATLKALTARSNAELFQIVEALADLHEHGVGRAPDPAALRDLCDATLAAVIRERDAFVARNQAVLLEALEAAA